MSATEPTQNNSPPNDMGLLEMTSGALAGLLAAGTLSSILGTSVPNIPNKDDVKKKIVERIAEKGQNVSFPLFEEFRKLKPPPADAAGAKAWADEALKFVNDSPIYQEFVKAEEKAVIHEMADVTAKLMGKKAVNSTDMIKAWELGESVAEKPSLLRRPLLAFQSLGTFGKITVGAAGLATAFGVAKFINNRRNPSESHTQKLERERIDAQILSHLDI